ncbi:MAG: hypothetical protein IK130_07220 [Oscillospiraceae bacterium]|nr:hypothetical protein [Oscillospiraceae bacterium]
MTLRELGIYADNRADAMQQAQQIMQTLSGSVRMGVGKSLIIGGIFAVLVLYGALRGHWLMALLAIVLGTLGIVGITGKRLDFDGSTGTFLYTSGRSKTQFQLTDITGIEEFTVTHHSSRRGHRHTSYYEDKIRIVLGEQKISFPLRTYRLMKNESSFNSGYSDIESLYRLLMLYKYYYMDGVGASDEQQLLAAKSTYARQTAASRSAEPAFGQNPFPASPPPADLPDDGGMPEI